MGRKGNVITGHKDEDAMQLLTMRKWRDDMMMKMIAAVVVKMYNVYRR